MSPPFPVRRGTMVDAASLYRRYAPLVYRSILRFFRDDEAQEVLHDVFVKVLEHADGFRGDAAASTWLYRITTNHCINRMRVNKRRRELLAENAEGAWRTCDPPTQEMHMLCTELWRSLPEDLLTIAIYHHIDGMTHSEIARVLGVSRRTVGNRLAALEQLTRGLS